jgi:hypothetical protein
MEIINANSDINKNKYSIDKAVEYANKENIISQQDIQNINISLQKIFDSETYLMNIKKDLILIFGDFIVSFNDIPAIVSLILDSTYMINNLIENKRQILHNELKYIVFGIMYRIMIDDCKISENENKILQNYEFIWKLITFSPLDNQKEASCLCFW